MKRLFIAVLLIAAVAAAGAQTKVVLRDLRGKVEIKAVGKDWVPARNDMVIDLLTTVSTGFDSTVTLLIGPNTVGVAPLTRLTVDKIVAQAGKMDTSLHLRVGKVSAEVKTSTGVSQNFQVTSPYSTASVRGTRFTYDGLTVQVVEGRVAFIPGKPRRPIVITPSRPATPGTGSPESPETGGTPPEGEGSGDGTGDGTPVLGGDLTGLPPVEGEEAGGSELSPEEIFAALGESGDDFDVQSDEAPQGGDLPFQDGPLLDAGSSGQLTMNYTPNPNAGGATGGTTTLVTQDASGNTNTQNLGSLGATQPGGTTADDSPPPSTTPAPTTAKPTSGTIRIKWGTR